MRYWNKSAMKLSMQTQKRNIQNLLNFVSMGLMVFFIAPVFGFGNASAEGITTGYHIISAAYTGNPADVIPVYPTGQAACDALRDIRALWLAQNGYDPTATYPFGGTEGYTSGGCWLSVSNGWTIGNVGPVGQVCVNGSKPDTTKPVGQQCVSNKSDGPSCVSTPYPIHTGTGNKYWSETDYSSGTRDGVTFVRYYNSRHTQAISTLDTAWRHNYDRKLTAGLTINSVNVVSITRPNGVAYIYTVNGNTYTSQDADVTDQLTAMVDTSSTFIGWKYHVVVDDSTETYDKSGKLLTVTSRSGVTQTFMYSNWATSNTVAPRSNLLLRVTDSFGRQLNFTYDSSGRIVTMTDPAGGHYQYGYDANNNLSTVTYPDTKTRTYLYNETAFTGGTNLPNALTGITDENNIRYASYYYDAQGRAYKEQQAGGVNQYQIGYSPDGSNSTITDPLGTTRTTNFQTVLGVVKGSGTNQPGGAGCGAASSAMTYDANGNVASRMDFNGNTTTYTYDLARNLEASRTEASGTAQARTISTQWHPTYRLAVAIAEPLRKTILNYDGSGNLLTKTIQMTTDANGSQGFSGQVTGTPRTWSYTYNQYGQLLTATGPRTDISDVTTYSYDTATGNLLTITNAAGQVTMLSNYDANGRVGTITDANGMTTNLSYYPRGWLHTKSVSNAGATQTTTYNYDGVGQLINVTLPDNSTITYTYDPAHRLTDIADSLNNSIHYTLDNMGNRISEQVKDPNSTLTRQTTRIYDALNRLQQVTGAVQ